MKKTTLDMSELDLPMAPAVTEPSTQKQLDLSVIVPVLNERESIKELCGRLHTVLTSLARQYEIIFIDDGSTDGTIDVIRAMRQRDQRIRYIRFRTNFGKSAALAAGFQVARYDVIATIDGDLQDLPEQLPSVITKLDEGYDVVSGWRYNRRDRLTRRLASKLYNWTTSKLTGVELHDMNCGLKCYRREVLREVKVYGERHRFIPVLASSRGFRLGEVRVEHAQRAHGESRFGMERAFAGVFSLISVILLTRYTSKPLHFFGLFGLAMAGLGSGITAYLIFTRIFFQQWLSNRPLLTIAVLFIIIGVYFLLFGLLAEMIAFSYQRESDYSILETSDSMERAGS